MGKAKGSGSCDVKTERAKRLGRSISTVLKMLQHNVDRPHSKLHYDIDEAIWWYETDGRWCHIVPVEQRVSGSTILLEIIEACRVGRGASSTHHNFRQSLGPNFRITTAVA